jgi:MYXO-CTERM domain-containing protein
MQTPYRSWSHRGLAISAIVLGLCSPVHAQDAGSDLATLQKNLADEQVALSTADCTMACRALGSIRRVADRICVLDPGEPCASARTKAEDATRRVREACPDCAIAAMVSPAPVRETSVATTDSAPPSESRRGGCAGCTTASPGANDAANAGGLVLVVAALAFRRRRRHAAP